MEFQNNADTNIKVFTHLTSSFNWDGIRWNGPPYLCQYDPLLNSTSIRSIPIENSTSIQEKFYEFSIFKITLEGMISLALVQLPGIVLGILGIIKAFTNHGCSKQAVSDAIRNKFIMIMIM